MGLHEEYPKARLSLRKALERALSLAPDLALQEREAISTALEAAAEKAIDLSEIVHRLAQEEHSPAEVGELLIAFELTMEAIRGHTDDLDGKLYEIGDRLTAMLPATSEKDV